MFKRCLVRTLSLTAFLAFIFLFQFSVPAKGVEGALPNQSAICLGAKFSNDGVLLTSEKYQFNPSGIDVYIVECISVPGGSQVCTSGETEVDEYLFGKNNGIAEKLNKIGYLKTDPKPPFQPTKSDTEGKVGPIYWRSRTRPSVSHLFLGITILPDEISTPGNRSLQLGTWFPANANTACASLRWDPYGRVFDSLSLEPIADIEVWLQTKDGPEASPTPVNLPMVINPQKTGPDGIFQFPVPDGTYYLEPILTNHFFPLPNNLEGLHPNYSLAYFDIYTGDKIVQKGKMEHRDIAVAPKGTPYRAEATIIDSLVVLNKLVAQYRISGGVSHPLSQVEVYNGKTKLSEVKTSKFGKFEITLDSMTIDPSQELTLKVIKTDLTALEETKSNKTSFWKKVKMALVRLLRPANAQTEVVKVPVILNYLEGYAYGSSGKPEPKATVGIYLTFSQNPFYLTTADEKGYFKIASQHLPSLPYNLKVTSAAGISTTLSPTQFSLLNKKYLAENQVNYGDFKPDPEIVVALSTTPSEKEKQSVTKFPGSGTKTKPGTGSTTSTPGEESQTSQTSALIFLVFVLLVLAGLGLYLFRKKKMARDLLNQNPPGPGLNS